MESSISYQFIMPDSIEYPYLTEKQCITTVDLEQLHMETVKEETKEEKKSKTSRKSKSKKPKQERRRHKFSKDQLSVLETMYSAHKYITLEQRKELSQTTSLTETQVKTWFQKRRFKEKKKAKQEHKLEEQWNKYLLDLVTSSTVEPFLNLLEYTDNYWIKRYRVVNTTSQTGNVVICPHEYFHGTTLKCPCTNTTSK